ncbi:hypothetical protein ACSS6W_000673 [Trichoderma asperelloides]
MQLNASFPFIAPRDAEVASNAVSSAFDTSVVHFHPTPETNQVAKNASYLASSTQSHFFQTLSSSMTAEAYDKSVAFGHTMRRKQL